MSTSKPIPIHQLLGKVIQAQVGVHEVLDSYGLDRTLHHLIVLRASQINRCAHCLKMHTKEAREHGETTQRMERLVVWDEVEDFSPAEKSVLAWTEALTTLTDRKALPALREDLREHFSDQEISVITATIAMINMWNRLGVASH